MAVLVVSDLDDDDSDVGAQNHDLSDKIDDKNDKNAPEDDEIGVKEDKNVKDDINDVKEQKHKP